jgi:hypothetical protein
MDLGKTSGSIFTKLFTETGLVFFPCDHGSKIAHLVGNKAMLATIFFSRKAQAFAAFNVL